MSVKEYGTHQIKFFFDFEAAKQNALNEPDIAKVTSVRRVLTGSERRALMEDD